MAEMRRIRLQVAATRLDEAYDALLPRLPGGIHVTAADEDVELVALGEQGELPPVEDVAAWTAHLARGPVVEEDAGPDLAHALAAVMPPHEVGGRILLREGVHPPAASGWIDVVLERGAGFGTGAHPTTRHCLELLLSLPPDGAFADLGCGAGALTIAAAKLGFVPVVGVDLIGEATATASRNAAVNGVEIDFVTADLQKLQRARGRDGCRQRLRDRCPRAPGERAVPDLRSLIVSGLDDPAQLATALTAYTQAGST